MSSPVFSKNTVLAIHATTIAEFGGLDGVRDQGLLDSALAQSHQTFEGQDLYPSAIEKACRYAFGIINNHPFIDGNKRTATALMGAYLRLSGLNFKPNHDDLLATILNVANGTLNYEGLVRWTRGAIG